MNHTQMRKEIFKRTAYLLEQYPTEQYVTGMGFQWDTLTETEQRKWKRAFLSVIHSMKISGRDESIKK